MNRAFAKARTLWGLRMVTAAQCLIFWRVLTLLTIDDMSDQNMPTITIINSVFLFQVTYIRDIETVGSAIL